MSITAQCGFNMTAADLQQVIPTLAAFCFNDNARALAVVGETTKSFEEIMLERIGRYAGNGSYIEMTGDDGLPFRWVFANGKVHKVRPFLAWPEPVIGQEGEYSHG